MRFRGARAALRAVGFDIVRYRSGRSFPPDLGAQDNEILSACLPYSATGPERMYALIQAVRYVVRAGIHGAIVECGVWRGGSLAAAARALRSCGGEDRELYGYDTFAGTAPPGEHDIDYLGQPAATRYAGSTGADGRSVWLFASLDEASTVIAASGYDRGKVHLIQGRVEDTIPSRAPSGIAILRLDTDFYQSTRHELEHLYPRLAIGGVLIVDDYGHWRGCRQAVDEYFAANGINVLLTRVDYTGRVAVKR